MPAIFGSLGAFALIVAIVAVCCVSHFVGFSNAWAVKNTTIRRKNPQFAKKFKKRLDKESCDVYNNSENGRSGINRL